MKREIKFRAWDCVAKKMLYTDETWIYKNGDWSAVDRAQGIAFLETDNLNGLLMQFTGMKDVNNKEIFEGDIVNIPYPISTDKAVQRIGFVEWLDQGARWVVHRKIGEKVIQYEFDANYGDENGVMDTKFEVIGNVFENPELLK